MIPTDTNNRYVIGISGALVLTMILATGLTGVPFLGADQAPGQQDINSTANTTTPEAQNVSTTTISDGNPNTDSNTTNNTSSTSTPDSSSTTETVSLTNGTDPEPRDPVTHIQAGVYRGTTVDSHRTFTPDNPAPFDRETDTSSGPNDRVTVTYTLTNNAQRDTPITITSDFHTKESKAASHTDIIVFPANETTSVTYTYDFSSGDLTIEHDGTSRRDDTDT